MKIKNKNYLNFLKGRRCAVCKVANFDIRVDFGAKIWYNVN